MRRPGTLTGLVVVGLIALAQAPRAQQAAGAPRQTSPPPAAGAGPTFDVVSIRRNTTPIGPGFSSGFRQRPDGGFTMSGNAVGVLLARAYPEVEGDMAGLPTWAMSDRYDVSATSVLTQATAEDRIAMLRAMLADRFKLVAHVEARERDTFDLVVARADRRLGAGLVPIPKDCAPVLAERQRAVQESGVPQSPPARPNFDAPPPECTLRVVGARPGQSGAGAAPAGDRLEGESTLDGLASMLRLPTRQVVVNKTGLTGSYRVQMQFDMRASLQPPDTSPAADAAADRAPSVFTALPEQLGLKLQPGRATRPTLVVDRLERPTDN